MHIVISGTPYIVQISGKEIIIGCTCMTIQQWLTVNAPYTQGDQWLGYTDYQTFKRFRPALVALLIASGHIKKDPMPPELTFKQKLKLIFS